MICQAQLKPSALVAKSLLFTALVPRPRRRTLSRDLAAHAVCLLWFIGHTEHSKTATNMQQTLVLQENVIATVLLLRMQLQAGHFAPVVPVLPVRHSLFTDIVLFPYGIARMFSMILTDILRCMYLREGLRQRTPPH
jgi:hypothetical protein